MTRDTPRKQCDTSRNLAITITITITIYYRPLASRTDIGLQHPSTTFLSRGRLLKHTRTPHLTQNTDPRNAHAGTKTLHQD